MLLLTEQDPLQTAFKLSDEFRKLSMIEIEFREEYLELVKVLEQFSCDLISQAWSSQEMESIMKYYHENQIFRLELLKKAQKYRQVCFVAQPNIQDFGKIQLQLPRWRGYCLP